MIDFVLTGLSFVLVGLQLRSAAVERVRALYAERIERPERRHSMLAASATEQASDAPTHAATKQLVDELADIERTELQRLQNRAVVDNLLARRLQHALDLRPMRDPAGHRQGTDAGPTS